MYMYMHMSMSMPMSMSMSMFMHVYIYIRAYMDLHIFGFFIAQVCEFFVVICRLHG